MKSVVVRLFERERGLFAGAVVIAAACIALGVPIDFVLFGLTLAGVDNPLFYKDNTRMLFGDAKKMLDEVLVALRA